MITCKRGIAAVGKVQLLFLWQKANFAPYQSQNYLTPHYKILNKWLRQWDKENCQIWLRSVLGERLPCGWNIVLVRDFLLVSLIRLQTAIRNRFWCIVAQKTSFGLRMCLLSIRSVKIGCKGSKSPKSDSVGKYQRKRKRPKNTL